MSPPDTGEEGCASRAIDAGVFSLPLLATLALLLPSGVLMPFRLVSLVLFAVALVEAIRRRGVGPDSLGVAAVAAVFLAVGVIGKVRFPAATSWTQLLYVFFIAVTCLALGGLGRRRGTLPALLWGWVISALVAAVVGVWELATARHLSVNIPARTWPALRPGWNKISAFFDNPNLYAYHIVVVLLLLPLLWPRMGRRTRWLLLPFAALELVLLVGTDARMALIALAVGAVLWALRHRWSRIVAAVLAAVFAATALLGLPPGNQARTMFGLIFGQADLEGSSIWVRERLIRSGLWIMDQTGHVLGAGPGGFEHWALSPANPYVYEALNNAHWGMLEVAVDYGFLTLAVLVIGLVTCAVAALRWTREAAGSWERTVAVGVLVLVVTLFALSMSHSTWLRQPLTALHLGTIVCMLARTSRARLAD